MDDYLSFGAGCFHLGVRKKPPFTLKGTDYINELQRTLQRISNLDNIQISAVGKFNDLFRALELDLKEELSEIHEGSDFFPPPGCFLNVSFEIYIPIRIQNELSPLGFPVNLNTERFRVHIHYDLYFPVTFIEPISPVGHCSPSDAIIVVREFLEKEFEKLKSDFLRFESLGPSPFHADFHLRAASKETKGGFDPHGFALERIQRIGYDVFNFSYDPSLYKDSGAAAHRLFFYLGSELSLFYRITHFGELEMLDWENLSEGFRNLVEAQKARGVKALWNSLWSKSRQIDDVIITVSEFESKQIWREYISQDAYRHLNKQGKELYLDSYIKRRMLESPKYPTGQIQNIVKLLEDRRSKSVENVIVIVAAVLGGIVGSLITLFVTKP